MDRLLSLLRSNRHTYSKVPAVTAWFWLVKALTTAMGESTSDWLVHLLVPEIAVVLGAIAFAVALYVQFTKDRYIPAFYWFAVAMVGVFGTMAADVLHVGLGVPYIASTIFFAIALAVVFRAWYVVEGTLSIHSIHTPRRELFYWAAVLATFALGTAAGDLTANSLGLGYFGSIWLFAAIIAIPAIGYFRLGMGSILAFWFAYVVTRPLGASVADWLSKSSGVGLGTGLVSVLFAAAIVLIVRHLARTGKDTPEDQFGGLLGDAQGDPAAVAPVIELAEVSKSYGKKAAVRDLSFVVRPGRVTGFLGPNGSGKSTTMRLILGLDAPDRGTVVVNGKRYRDHRAPLHQIGALLDASSFHTGRSARDHLLAMAQTHGLGRERVEAMIDLVGLGEVAGKRAGTFSLGMRQRLGIASALLADPRAVMLDEPINGLDPEGILWVRNLLKGLAEEGRTVFVSSHLMSEMALTADHLIVIGKGELIADVGVQELVSGASSSAVRVRSPHAARLGEVLAGPEVRVRSLGTDLIELHGVDAEEVGLAAHVSGIVLYELAPRQASLEDAFMELTGESIEFRAGDGAASAERVAA